MSTHRRWAVVKPAVNLPIHTPEAAVPIASPSTTPPWEEYTPTPTLIGAVKQAVNETMSDAEIAELGHSDGISKAAGKPKVLAKKAPLKPKAPAAKPSKTKAIKSKASKPKAK